MGLAKLSHWKGRLIVSVLTLSCRKRTAPGEAAVSSAVKRKTTPALFHTKETSVLPGLCPCGPVQTLIPSHLKTGRFPNWRSQTGARPARTCTWTLCPWTMTQRILHPSGTALPRSAPGFVLWGYSSRREPVNSDCIRMMGWATCSGHHYTWAGLQWLYWLLFFQILHTYRTCLG